MIQHAAAGKKAAIAEAAQKVDQLRNNWRNPSEWTRDRLVYELYGLTEEEIGIVEGVSGG